MKFECAITELIIMAINPAQMNSDLAAISLTARIPAFWTDMPRMWFVQFEAIIGPQHQGENVKYDLVVAKLGKEELSQVADLIDDPPAQERYTILKNRLLKVFQESAEAQFNKLVKEMDLGQQRPSQLLARMRELARNTGSTGDTVKNLWLTRLPGWVRAILASCKESKLEELSEMADKIMDNLRSGEISEMEKPSTSQAIDINSSLLAEFRSMALELKTLRGEVNELRGRDRQRGQWQRSAHRRRSRTRSRGPQRTPQSPDWLCKYHFRYKATANKCEAPCNWVSHKGN